MPASPNQPLLDHAANRKLWEAHNKVVTKARAARACLRCATEAGFISTDKPLDEPREYEMHKECKERIVAALGVEFTTYRVQS